MPRFQKGLKYCPGKQPPLSRLPQPPCQVPFPWKCSACSASNTGAGFLGSPRKSTRHFLKAFGRAGNTEQGIHCAGTSELAPCTLRLTSASASCLRLRNNAGIMRIVTFYDSGKTAIFSTSSLHPAHKTAHRFNHKANSLL